MSGNANTREFDRSRLKTQNRSPHRDNFMSHNTLNKTSNIHATSNVHPQNTANLNGIESKLERLKM